MGSAPLRAESGRPGRLGPRRAHRRPRRRHRAVRRLVPRRLARAGLRRAHRRGRAPGRGRDRACAPSPVRPGPGSPTAPAGCAPTSPRSSGCCARSPTSSAIASPPARFAPFARMAAGAEVGALLGWMSTRVLGQYDLLVVEDEDPEEQDIVYYVGPNVLALEKRFAFPPREFRLWLALHEVTHRAQFTGVPWMRAALPRPRRAGARLRRPRPDPRPARRPAPGRRGPHPAQPVRRRRAGDAARHAGAGGRPRPDRRAHEPARRPRRRDHGPRRRRPRSRSAERFGRVLRARRRAVSPGDPPAPAAPRARGEAEPVRAGRAVHRGRRAPRRTGAAQLRLRGADDAADARRDPCAGTLDRAG